MFIKKIKYTDFKGVEREEEFCFNFTRAEVVNLQLGTEGGFSEKMKRIVEAKDSPAMSKFFTDLILDSYGVISDDGRRFEKSDELKTAFKQTEAFSIIYMELATDADLAAEFVKRVFPPQEAASK